MECIDTFSTILDRAVANRKATSVQVNESAQINKENAFNSQLLDQIRLLTENQLRLHRERSSLMEQIHKNTRLKDEMELEIYNQKNISKNFVHQIKEVRKILSEKEVESNQLLMEITRRNEEIFKIDIENQKYKENLETVLQRNVELTNENLLLEKKCMEKRKASYNKPLPILRKKSGGRSMSEPPSSSSPKKKLPLASNDNNKERLTYIPFRVSHQVECHKGSISSLEMFEEGRYPLIVTGGERDQFVKVWNLEGKLQSVIKVNLGGMISFMSIHRRTIAVGGNSQEIHVFGLDPNNLNPSNRTKVVLKGHSKTITDCKVVNNFVISGSLDKSVKVWSLDNNVLYRTFQLQSDVLSLCVINPVFFCSSHVDGVIRFFDFRNPKVVKEVEAKGSPPITMMGYCAAKNSMMVKTSENVGYLMDIGTFGFRREYNFENMTSNFCFDRTGSTAMLGGSSGMISLWDVENTKQPRATIRDAHFGNTVTRVTSCGPYNYFSASEDGKLNFYSLRCAKL